MEDDKVMRKRARAQNAARMKRRVTQAIRKSKKLRGQCKDYGYKQRLRAIEQLAVDRNLPAEITSLLSDMMLTDLPLSLVPKAPSLLAATTPPRPTKVSPTAIPTACQVDRQFHRIYMRKVHKRQLVNVVVGVLVYIKITQFFNSQSGHICAISLPSVRRVSKRRLYKLLLRRPAFHTAIAFEASIK
jgi:hypothetical protein